MPSKRTGHRETFLPGPSTRREVFRLDREAQVRSCLPREVTVTGIAGAFHPNSPGRDSKTAAPARRAHHRRGQFQNPFIIDRPNQALPDDAPVTIDSCNLSTRGTTPPHSYWAQRQTSHRHDAQSRSKRTRAGTPSTLRKPRGSTCYEAMSRANALVAKISSSVQDDT